MSLVNDGNMAYMGELYMGAPISQKITDIIFDSGSDVLAVMSTNCVNCFYEDDAAQTATPTQNVKISDIAYDENHSLASKAHNKNVNESYGSAELYGPVYNDTVCLDSIDIRD